MFGTVWGDPMNGPGKEGAPIRAPFPYLAIDKTVWTHYLPRTEGPAVIQLLHAVVSGLGVTLLGGRVAPFPFLGS